MLTVDLFPFVGVEGEGGQRTLRPRAEWDFDGARRWIAENPESVHIAWQRVVRDLW